MKTTSKLLALALSASALFFSSCKEDETINESALDATNQDSGKPGLNSEEILIPSTATVVDVNSHSVFSREENTEVDEFAKLLAKSLKDEEMRTFLKYEAEKKFMVILIFWSAM